MRSVGTEILNYASPSQPLSWWRVIRCVAGWLIVVAAIVHVATARVVFVESEKLDPITGSTSTELRFLGVRIDQSVNVSPFEQRLVRDGIPWNRSHIFLVRKVGRSLVGGVLTRGCGRTEIQVGGRLVLPAFVQHASNAQLRELIHAIEHGTPDEQAAAVEATWYMDFPTKPNGPIGDLPHE